MRRGVIFQDSLRAKVRSLSFIASLMQITKKFVCNYSGVDLLGDYDVKKWHVVIK